MFKNIKKYVVIICLMGGAHNSYMHAFDVDALSLFIEQSKNVAILIAPGFITGFATQTHFKKPSIYHYAAGMALSIPVTDYVAYNYLNMSSDNVRECKYSQDSACAAGFFTYWTGVSAGFLWKAYRLKRA